MVVSILFIVGGFILIKYGIAAIMGGTASLLGNLGIKKEDDSEE